MKRFIPLLFTIFASANLPESIVPPHQMHLRIDNRPLVRIHGHTISLMDVVKKMDVYINEHQPDIFRDPTSLYQFYMSNWRSILDELITTEMIITDAEDKQINLSEGDIREELETRFGPNISASLDKLSLTYQEAYEMIRRQMIVDRMKWYKVHSKAFQEVTPQIIKNAYKELVAANPPTSEWNYRFLSIRGKDEKLCLELAEKAGNLRELGSLEEVKEKLSETLQDNGSVTISISNDYSVNEKSISKDHRAILDRLGINSHSDPIATKTRKGESVHRIFHLKEKSENTPEAFDDAYDSIKDKLLSKKVYEEEKAYVEKLKEKYNLTDEILTGHIDESYQPFAIK